MAGSRLVGCGWGCEARPAKGSRFRGRMARRRLNPVRVCRKSILRSGSPCAAPPAPDEPAPAPSPGASPHRRSRFPADGTGGGPAPRAPRPSRSKAGGPARCAPIRSAAAGRAPSAVTTPMIWQTRPERWKSADTATDSSGKSMERRWRSLVYAARLSREGKGMRTRVTISPGFLRLFQTPSARKKSFRPTSRAPLRSGQFDGRAQRHEHGAGYRPNARPRTSSPRGSRGTHPHPS